MTYKGYISRAYFPRHLHPREIGCYFEWFKVKADSRTEAATLAWRANGERWLAAMNPVKDEEKRIVSLHVNSPKAGRGGLAGRLCSIKVHPSSD